MSASFHLLDLAAQAAAVQEFLHGRTTLEKLDWIAARGQLDRLAKSVMNMPETYRFVSTIGMECIFFIDGDELVIIR